MDFFSCPERYRPLVKAAYRQALLSEHDSFKHGAVLFRGHRILGAGRNHFGQRGWVARVGGYGDNQRIHAEIECLHFQGRERVQGSDLLVVRIGRTGAFRNSMPCPQCQELMKRQGIRTCFFSTGEGTLGSIRLN